MRTRFMRMCLTERGRLTRRSTRSLRRNTDAPQTACLLDSSGEAAGGEDVLRVEGGLEAMHLGGTGNQFGARVCWEPTGSLCGNLLAPEARSFLQGARGEEKRCVAACGENKIENLGDGLRETRGGVFVCRCWEQCEIDCAAGAGDECVGQCGAFGDVLKVCEERGVVTGKNADLENDGCGRGFEKHGEAFAEASPDGGTRCVTQDSGGSRARFFGEQSEFARIAVEDFGCAREGGAELPLARVKPIADRRERSLVRGAVFSGEDGGFRRRWSSRGEDLG